ncbi:hypothetical protein ACHAXH_009550 [Discostella pseudostelligera]
MAASQALLEMGLQQSPLDPCLFHEVPLTPDHPASPDDEPLSIRLYVDDVVYYSPIDLVEKRFEQILAAKFQISFMGVVNWFLGTHFTWLDLPDGNLSVHLSQVAYAQNLVERHRQQNINVNPCATPYRSGLPIDSIHGAPPEDFIDPTFLHRREMYQSMVGSLNWLATNTRPDLAPVMSFLAAYNNNPSQGHVEAALYAIKYLRQMVDYGIAFHSSSSSLALGFIHFPFHHDITAYSDALPPTAAEQHELTAYSDACWGSQLGGTPTVGDEIEGSNYVQCRGPIDLVEKRFEQILAAKFQISFMGVVNWFLGTHFTWLDLPDGNLSVHLSQVAYAQNLVERHRQQNINVNPCATPYRSGLPIDSIHGAPPEDFIDPTFLHRREMYQSMVGSLNWLATNTRPDLAPVMSFLAAYNNNPSQGHVEAALYAIKYLRQMVDYGIAFHSSSSSLALGFIHFPFHHDITAYSDALPPTAAEQHELTAYSDACWGSQLGGTPTVGDEIEGSNYVQCRVTLSSGLVALLHGLLCGNNEQAVHPVVKLKFAPLTNAPKKFFLSDFEVVILASMILRFLPIFTMTTKLV